MFCILELLERQGRTELKIKEKSTTTTKKEKTVSFEEQDRKTEGGNQLGLNAFARENLKQRAKVFVSLENNKERNDIQDGFVVKNHKYYKNNILFFVRLDLAGEKGAGNFLKFVAIRKALIPSQWTRKTIFQSL